MAVDRDNHHVYVGGFISPNARDYDPDPSDEVLLTTTGTGDSPKQGGYDSWIAQFDATGDLGWAKSFGSSGNDRIDALAAKGGFVYATGWQSGAEGDWDTGSGTIQLGSTTRDLFAMKMNSSGQTQWAVAWGGSGTSTNGGTAIAVDSSGNVYSAGHFNGTADLDSGAGTNNFTTDSGIDTGYMVKHNSSGAYVWGNAFPVTGDSRMYGLASDGSSNVYLSGYFQGTMDFDPGSDTVEITSAGNSEGFVAKYNAAGELADGNIIQNPPSGFQIIDGSVDGNDLQGRPAEVVKTAPLCAGGEWTFDHDTPGVATRQYVIQDSALAASGLGVGEYIKTNFHDGTSTLPTHNLLWVGMHIDHDGNTSQPSQYWSYFGIIGWVGNQFSLDVANAADPVTFKLFSDGNFKWKSSATPETWIDSNVDYDGAGPSPTGVIPSGWSIYLGFAAKDATTRTLPNHALNVSQVNCAVASFTRTPATVTVSEAGTTGTFTVVLDSQPSGNVVFDVSASDTGEATVDKLSLIHI